MVTEQVDLTLHNMNDSLALDFNYTSSFENFHFKNAGDCECNKGKKSYKGLFSSKDFINC